MLRNSNNRNRDYLRSERIIRRRRRRRMAKLIFFLILLIVVIVGFVFVSRLSAFSVNNISVEGNQSVSTADIDAVVQNVASTSWMYVFPRKNILLFPTNALEAELRARYPRLSAVFVHRTGIDSIDVQVIERQPRAVWCDDNDNCYNMDDQGFIFATTTEDAFLSTASSSTSTSDFIKFTGGAEAGVDPIGTTINSSSTFSDIATLLQGMKDQGLTPEEVDIRDPHEFSVKVLPGDGDVIFSDTEPLSDSLANLETALQSPAFKATSTQPTFDYIDTRFGNKIFFKLKQ